MILPRFIPVLTTFATRVSGHGLDELLQSPTALARALVDTQKVIGHDGVLCLHHPAILVSACMGRQGPLDWVADWNSAHADAATLAPAAEVPGAEPMATLFEAIPAVRHALPGEISVYAAFAGPGLLHRQLRDALRDGSRGAWDDSDFVAQAVLAAVRQSFEVKADGVALLEQTVPTLPAELLRVHKKVRKMADFYNAGFLVFDSAVAEPSAAALPAHCSFAIGAGPPRIERVTGRLGAGLEGYNAPVTTAGDVPADSPVAAVQSLMRPQTGTQSTQGPQAGIADLA